MRCSILVLAALGVSATTATGQGVPEKYQPAVQKGLAWLVKQQKADGSWPAETNQSTVSATALAGLALLAEGSTSTKGKYADALAKAVYWLQANDENGEYQGLLARRELQSGNYMVPHSQAMLFLASVYELEAKDKVGKKVEDILNRRRREDTKKALASAIAFTVKAQLPNGGWFFTSAQNGGNLSEVTAWQIQALRASQQAGFDVPKEAMQKAFAYLEKNTTQRGGVTYSSGGKLGGERPGVTLAAVACCFKPEEYDAELPTKWLKFCKTNATAFALGGSGAGADELFHGARVMHGLGEKGAAKVLGKDSEVMKWSEYRTACYDSLIAGADLPKAKSPPFPRAKGQNEDGSWSKRRDGLGPVYTTAVCLIVLQLDNEAVPMFRAKKR